VLRARRPLLRVSNIHAIGVNAVRRAQATP
jgi:hypothetical protein